MLRVKQVQFRIRNLPKTVKLNFRKVEFGGLRKAELLAKLKNSSILLNEYANILLSSNLFITSKTRQIVSVIEISINDLGFSDGANLAEVRNRARELGLLECPIELGPYFRLQYLDQVEDKEISKNKAPKGSVTIISKPLLDSDDFPKGFYLRRINGKLWLRGYKCDMEYKWEPFDMLAFLVSE
jgi:hypothetical protein